MNAGRPVVKQTTQSTNDQETDRVSKRDSIRDALVVLTLILVGCILRVDFMRAAGFTIDADEAIVGLMGRDILLGRGVPVFYYGQHYMGSLEAIMASLSFAFLGTSPFTLKLVPLVWSLALIVAAYFLGRLVAGRRVGLITALLLAIPPPALLVWSTKARGGFIEVIVLGTLALGLGIQWFRAHPEKPMFPALLGFLLGMGWWVNNQIIYFILPLSFMGVLHAFSRISRLTAPGLSVNSTQQLGLGVLKIACIGVSSFFLGSAPYWWYNLKWDFPSVGMFKVAAWDQFIAHLEGFWLTALPVILGAQRFWQRESVFPYSKQLALILYLLPLLVLVYSRRKHVVGLLRGRVDRKQPIELLLLFCISCALVFAVSSFGWLAQAPRYLLPMYVGLFPLVAICCDRLLERSVVLGWFYLLSLLSFQVAASYTGGRGITGEPMVFGGHRVARDHAPLIDTLEKLGISQVRTNYWIGYRLAFESEEKIVFTVLGEPTQVRIPRYEELDARRRAELPLVLVQAEVAVVKPALKRFGYSFKEVRAGEYTIIYNVKESGVSSRELDLDSIGYVARASGSTPAKRALDRDDATRWGTGEPQRPGQMFEIELSRPVDLTGISYVFGQWASDKPAELQVEIEDERGQRIVVLSQRESPGAMHLVTREPQLTLRFEPIRARKVVLKQLGRHPVLDWSIAELLLYEATSEKASNANELQM